MIELDPRTGFILGASPFQGETHSTRYHSGIALAVSPDCPPGASFDEVLACLADPGLTDAVLRLFPS